jgi:hypothetical protein
VNSRTTGEPQVQEWCLDKSVESVLRTTVGLRRPVYGSARPRPVGERNATGKFRVSPCQRLPQPRRGGCLSGGRAASKSCWSLGRRPLASSSN